MKLFIDTIRKATEEVIDDMKWPAKVKAIKRAFESVEDGVEVLKIDNESKLTDLRKALTKADESGAKDIIKRIAALKIEQEQAEHLAEIVKAEQVLQFAEVKEGK